MRTVNLTIPLAWSELTGGQLLFIAELFLEGQTRNAFLLKAFLYLSGLKILPGRSGDKNNPVYWFSKKQEKPFPLSLGELTDFSKECEFLLEERQTFRPLQQLEGRVARDVMMYDACFGEFIAAMIYYNQFKDIQTDSLFLYKLCAIMYPDDDFDQDNIRYKQFEKLPVHECYTAYLWFGMILNKVSSECPNLFREPSSDAEPVNLRENIHSMYNLVTEHDITKEKEVSRIDMWRVLYDMDEKARRIKETNENIERNGRI